MIFFNKRSTFVPYIRGREITTVANYAALPDPTTVGDKFYWCENSQGTAWLPGSLGGTYYPRGLYYSNGTTWEYMETPIQATQAEVDAGIIDDRFVSPNTLANADQWNSVKIKLYTNGTQNTEQNKLNLVEGTNMTIIDDGSGNITFDATGGGGSGIPKATAAGTDIYTTTITGVTGYADGDTYLIRFTNGNTDTSTLNINTLGAKTLYRNNDGILIGGDIWNGAEMLCVFNSTLDGFQCIGTSPNSLFAYVANADSVTINRGQPVYAFGSTGNRMSVKLANNSTDATSAQTYGLVYSTSIAAGQKGIIIIQGVLDGLNLGGTWVDGDPVYLGNTAGGITKTKPFAPNHLVYLGVVERANAGNGIMYVRVQNGYELDELHDVSAQTPANKDGLFYNSTTGLWEARQVAATDIDPNVSNTEFSYLNGVTSAIQTQLNNIPTPISTIGTGVTVTGTTANTISASLLVPANSRTAGQVVTIVFATRKSGGANTHQPRLYWNTSPSLIGAILLASNGAHAAAVQSSFTIRDSAIEVANGTGNGTMFFPTTVNANNPYGAITAPINNVAINWTAAGYFIVAIQNGSTLDSSSCAFITLK